MLNMVRDAVGVVHALGYRSVAMLVGHDAGAPVASWAALIRPDIFRSVVIMSSPFAGAPDLPFNTANGAPMPPSRADRRMRTRACSRMVGVQFLEGAGHWVQQEQPEPVSRLLVQFLRDQPA